MRSRIEPCWIDHLAMALAKPWVFILAIGFILIPTDVLLGAMRSGAAFLKIGTGARPTAMGEAYTALADDVNALYYNPGGLARLPKRELGATHTEWLLGTKFDFIGYAHPTSLGTFGLGLTRLTGGDQEGRDANRQATAGFAASDTAYALAFSRRLDNGGTSLGTSLKFLQSRIGSYSASTFAMDFGAQRQLKSRPMTLGVSLLNVGQGMRYLSQRDPLPLTMSAGAAYRLGGVLQMAVDVRHEVPDRRTSVGIGTEYAVFPSFALRMGYGSGLVDAGSGPWAEWAAGSGSSWGTTGRTTRSRLSASSATPRGSRSAPDSDTS
ncbi:MAG: PorV/PorQ family protein [Planctomycetota bacterium]